MGRIPGLFYSPEVSPQIREIIFLWRSERVREGQLKSSRKDERKKGDWWHLKMTASVPQAGLGTRSCDDHKYVQSLSTASPVQWEHTLTILGHCWSYPPDPLFLGLDFQGPFALEVLDSAPSTYSPSFSHFPQLESRWILNSLLGQGRWQSGGQSSRASA